MLNKRRDKEEGISVESLTDNMGYIVNKFEGGSPCTVKSKMNKFEHVGGRGGLCSAGVEQGPVQGPPSPL